MSDPGVPGEPGRAPDSLDASGPAAERSGAPGAPGGAPGPGGGVLVIGYGNGLRSDDGVGVHAAGLLARDPRLVRAEVRAAVQLAPELALDMSRASLVVLVDATVDAAPGQVLVRRLAGSGGAAGAASLAGTGKGASGPVASGPGTDPGPGTGPSATSHHVGVEELVALAGELYGAAPEVVIVSVGVATMEAGETLSPEVAAALPAVADAVAEVVAARGPIARSSAPGAG